MSKKKNTLRDLDEFLKQQAASLVSPEPVAVSPAAGTYEQKDKVHHPEADPRSLIAQLQALAKQEPQTFRKEFYDIIVQTVESFPSSSAEDKMLINTALYLKSGDRWKDVIREYWKKNS